MDNQNEKMREPLEASTGIFNNQTTVSNSQVSQEPTSKVPFERYFKKYFNNENRKKGALFIIVPLLILVCSPMLGPIFIATLLMSPILFIFIIYGVVLQFKKDKQILEENRHPSTINKTSYKHGLVVLVLGFTLILLGFFSILSTRSDAGYSGSEGEIGAFPFLLSGIIFILISLVTLAVAFIRNSKESKGSEFNK